jgi:2-succinyl-5-enolpyruvyl-6-hydroxy-3-cyclohexene-1-carboxylate synthase
VQLNLPLDEPLVPPNGELGGEPEPGRPDGAPWTATHGGWRAPSTGEVEALVAAVRQAPRGLLVAGWGAGVRPEAADAFAAASGWPVLADPLSGLRHGPFAIAAYDALLRVPSFAAAHRPELVVRVGAGPTSKALTNWLDAGVPQVLLDPDNAWVDPLRAASTRLAAEPNALLEAAAKGLRAGAGAGAGPAGAAGAEADAGVGAGSAGRAHANAGGGPGPALQDGAWRAAWMEADARALKAIGELLDGWDDPFEGRVARDLVAGLPDGATLVAGSSMPVRDLDAFALPRDGLVYLANRGASGIDGFVATALGAAAVAPGPVAALCGDLTFLHDATSVLTARARRPGVAFVVVDNDGGGIFSFLPQAALPPALFEPLFGTPHGLDLAAVAAAAGLDVRRIGRAADLPPALAEALAADTTAVLIVPSDRPTNLSRHRAVTAAVADALA